MINEHDIAHDITIAKPEHVSLLEEHMPTDNMPDTHRQRFKLQQEGKGFYLLAWQEQLPVGHVLFHFRDPVYHSSRQHYPECAYVEALTTRPDKQRQGVATSLMQIAEFHARQHQAESIGLSVGIDNPPAQALYRKMGYQPTDIPPYTVTWNYLDKTTGEVKQEGELCHFWVKSLA
jgi:ribosomal protein S18 acetylase RimI-like enzyme